MARKTRLFSTAPITAMQDGELTGLEWRLLLWVSLHDGMSLVKGNGAGCYASNLTLFAEAGCEYSAGCRALSSLVKRGHLQREHVGRSTRYRVVFGIPDNLQAGNLSPAKHVAGSQAGSAGYVAEGSEQPAEILTEQPLDYSSLSEELDSVETEEINSSEEAHLSGAHLLPENVFSIESLRPNLRADRGKEPAEAGLGGEWLIAAQLPRNFPDLPPGAQVARIEGAFGSIGRDPDRLDSRERQSLTEFLIGVADDFSDEPFGQQAQRLSEEIAQW